MSKKIVIFIFIALQCLFIFFYIYLHSTLIHLTYSFQDTERTLDELEKRKKALTYELLQLQEAEKLKHYSVNSLQMKKIRMSDINQLPTS